VTRAEGYDSYTKNSHTTAKRKGMDQKEKGMNPNKIIAALTPIATLVVAIFGLYFWVDGHYVHLTPEFKSLEKRFEVKEKSDYIREINTRIWSLEDELKKNPSNQAAEGELRRLKEDKTTAEAELAALRK